MAKQVAKTESKELITGIDFTADAGTGMEGTDKDSFAIPFLRVLQKISPQVDEADAAYIEGAKGGMILNTVTNRLYDGKEGLIFLPCAFQRRYIQWAPRGSGQGFKGEWLPEDVRGSDEVKDVDGALMVGDDRLVDTRSHFGIVIDGDEIHQVVLPLASTQIKKSKQLMSILSSARIQGVNPPTWMNRIKVTTVLESNDQGSWYGVKFEADGFIDSADLYQAGKDFHDTVAAGEAKVAYEQPTGDDSF